MSVDKDIRYSITAEDRFARTFANLRRDVSTAGSVMGGLVDKANMVGAALGAITLGAVGGAGLGLAFKQLVNDLDALNDAADATGSSIENLSALEDIAKRNGDSLQTVVEAALKLNKVLNDAKPGSPMEQTLQRIGLSAAELRKDDPSIALQKLAQALAGFADDGDKARLVLDLTGKAAKDLAPILKALAEAGELNAKNTAEQAAEADKFNKQLFAFQANASAAARTLVADLLPAANDYLVTVRQLAQVPPFTLFKRELVSEVQSLRLKVLVADIEALTDQLSRQPDNTTLQKLLGDARNEYDQLARAAAAANEQLKATLGVQAAAKEAGGGRGFINPPLALPTVGGPAPAPAAVPTPSVTEAQRYLETLQKQGERLQELTTYQQLLADIENRRIDGLTPKLERELRQAAQRVDLQRQLNAEVEKEVGFQKLLADKDQRDLDEVQRLLSQTNTGRLQGLEGQADKLLEFSRRIAEDDPRQAQVLEAMKRLREEAQQIANPATEAATAYDKLADSIEKSMDRATDSILDMVVEGKGGIGDLGKAFARDVLRALIGDPVRDTMKEVAASIRAVFKGQGGLEGLLASLISTVGGMFGGGGGNTETNVGNDGFGGYGSRALGGPVNAGQLYRWQENGREWFVPNQDGTVMTQPQMRAMAGGQVNQTNHFHISGGNPAETQRMIEAALARNNAQLLRSRNTGGAFAGA